MREGIVQGFDHRLESCHYQVLDLIKESRQALADSLFSWTCQSPLTKDDTLALIGHLETVTVEADGSLDSVNLSLVMALLYCLDVSFLEQGTEDREGKMNKCWIQFIEILSLNPQQVLYSYNSCVHTVLCSHVQLNVNTFIYFASNSGTLIFLHILCTVFAGMELNWVLNCPHNGLKKKPAETLLG